MDDSSGNWPKWLTGALNVASGVLQAAAGAVIGVAASWTGVGAAVAGFLIVNGAATVVQGIGQIVNDAADSNVLREDNIIRTGASSIGRAMAGKKGAVVAEIVYDTAVVAASLYTPSPKTPVTTAVNTQCTTYNLNGAKDSTYIAKRGWNDEMINSAISNGKQGTSINMANSAPCTVYRYPGTQNQYVVIENTSRSIVQASNFNDTGWIPDSRIVWDP